MTATTKETAERLEDLLVQWQVATGDPLLSGRVPAPAGASVAPRDAWSSTTADTIGTGGEGERETDTSTGTMRKESR